MRTQILAVVALLLAACQAIPSINAQTEQFRAQTPLQVSPSIEVSPETGVAAGALIIFGHPIDSLGLPGEVFSPFNAALLYIVYDPLAPNWRIEEKILNEDTYYLSMRAKSFRTGGDGESIQIFKRRALKLQRERGYVGYRILDYSEGVESSTPLTHRVSEGTIQLVKAPASPQR